MVERLRRPREEGDEGETPPGTPLAESSSQVLDRLLAHKPRESRYELIGEAARGGMGAILRVWDKPLKRHIAMKVISGPGLADKEGSPPPSASFVRRFVEEAQITGQLDHPGVVPVYEMALNEEGEVFFTMRLVRIAGGEVSQRCL